ncbi:hypothetical protein D3C79_642590 [compost metagenome]
MLFICQLDQGGFDLRLLVRDEPVDGLPLRGQVDAQGVDDGLAGQIFIDACTGAIADGDDTDSCLAHAVLFVARKSGK